MNLLSLISGDQSVPTDTLLCHTDMMGQLASAWSFEHHET